MKLEPRTDDGFRDGMRRNVSGQIPIPKMAGRTRAIVRLEGWNRMVTKGYRKGVYERVT
jgi:hypothetical protein